MTVPDPLLSSARTRQPRARHGRTEQHGEVCRFPAPGIEEANHLSFAEREEDMHPGAIQETEQNLYRHFRDRQTLPGV